MLYVCLIVIIFVCPSVFVSFSLFPYLPIDLFLKTACPCLNIQSFLLFRFTGRWGRRTRSTVRTSSMGTARISPKPPGLLFLFCSLFPSLSIYLSYTYLSFYLSLSKGSTVRTSSLVKSKIYLSLFLSLPLCP